MARFSILFFVWIDSALGDWDSAVEAFKRGDYEGALREIDPLLAAAVAVGLLLLLGWFWRRLSYFIASRLPRVGPHQREKELARLNSVATTMGFSAHLEGKIPDQVATSSPKFNPETVGTYGSTVNNLLHGDRDGIYVCVFDRYEFVVEVEIITTKVLFYSPEMDLPRFFLRSEDLSSVFHQVGKLLGPSGIRFLEYPEFSEHYHLKGDEEGVRALFSSQMIEYFIEHQGWSVEGYGQLLLVYQYGKRREIEEYPDFVDETFSIYKLFR